MIPQLRPRRGGPVKVGNVYANPTGRFYKVVIGIIPKDFGRREKFANIAMLHIDSLGRVCGAACQPEGYVQNHQDPVGVVKNMPSLKIEWLPEKETKR